MFYHNATRYDSFELAAAAAALAARNGEAQTVERGSDHRVWTGYFRKYDPELPVAAGSTVQAPAAPAPSAAPAALPDDPRLTALMAMVADLTAQVARLSAPKGRKAPKSKGSTALPDDPLGF